MKIAFLANVKNFNGIYTPDIDVNFIKYTQGGGAVYNADKTACVVIADISAENENIIKSALKLYGINLIEETQYTEIEKEYPNFINTMTKTLAGA